MNYLEHMNTLIVEDEKDLANEIKEFLISQGYQCDIALNGRTASEKIFVNEYDFVLLDLGLPDTDGFAILEEARKHDVSSAFIILTARGAIDDRVKGLDMGADDYLPKPFSLVELQSRMQAITRRKHGLQSNTIQFHGFEMDMQNRMLSYNGTEVNLTKKEFNLLHYLILNKNRVLTRVQLTEHIWGDILEEDNDSNYIDVHIKNIRKKMSVSAPVDWIETVRGIGYRARK